MVQRIACFMFSLILSISLLSNVVYGFHAITNQTTIEKSSACEDDEPSIKLSTLNLSLCKTVSYNYSQNIPAFVVPTNFHLLVGTFIKNVLLHPQHILVNSFVRNVFYVFISTNAP